MKKYCTIIFYFIFLNSLNSSIINVPDDQSSIQGAINIAETGDTVLVQPGTYPESIDFLGKNIIVAGLTIITDDTAYIRQTIIQPSEWDHRVVSFENGEDSTAILLGFTITGGRISTSFGGAGIRILNASPQLKHLIVSNNRASDIWDGQDHFSPNGGGGIGINNSTSTISNVIISNNTVYGYGGGIYIRDSDIIMRNVEISHNTAVTSEISGYAGGILAINSQVTINNFVISKNICDKSAYDGGGGGVVFKYNSQVILTDGEIYGNVAKKGGGLSISNSGISMTNVVIYNNEASSYGGGVVFNNSEMILKNVKISNNMAKTIGGGIYFSGNSNNISTFSSRISGNRARIGKELSTSDLITFSIDTFIVLHPSSYHLYPLEKFDLDIDNAIYQQFDRDLYVSPLGNDQNSGIDPDMPLQTVSHALNIYYDNRDKPNKVVLLPGTYGDESTDEHFPLNFFSYLNIEGTDRDSCIIEGSGTTIASMYLCDSVLIKNVTLKKGVRALNIESSKKIELENLTISENGPVSTGAGLNVNKSEVRLNDLNVYENIATEGGGIYLRDSFLSFRNTTIRNNEAISGSGIYFFVRDTVDFDRNERCNIYLNHATTGKDLYASRYEDLIEIVLDTFTVMPPQIPYMEPIEKFSIEVKNAIITQLNADLFISPNGDDNNSGLSFSEPLKTISHTIDMIITSVSEPHTIFLENGVYSAETNGELFPLILKDGLSIEGKSADSTILDGNNLVQGMKIDNKKQVKIANLTIQKMIADEGGGIYTKDAKFSLNNVILKENQTSGISLGGAGIYLNESNVTINDCHFISNNSPWRNSHGGGIFVEESDIVIKNSIFKGNHTGSKGGAFHQWYGENVSFANVIFDNNSGNFAGGVSIHETSASFEDCVFRNNRSTSTGSDPGGAAAVLIGKSFYFNRVLFRDNEAWLGAGCVLWEYSGVLLLKNCTFYDNTAVDGGSIIAGDHDNGRIIVINSILWENSQPQVKLNKFSDFAKKEDVIFYHSDIQGGYSAIDAVELEHVFWQNNIDQDPLFVSVEDSNFNLQQFSPCIDAGVTSFSWNTTLYFDESENDYHGLSPDQGAFESEYQGRILVHPGDTDNNGVVDERDILPIGIYLNQDGTSRVFPSNDWVPQYCYPWEDIAMTFVDVNGDGQVLVNDVDVMIENFGKTHSDTLKSFVIDPSDTILIRQYSDNFEIILSNLQINSNISLRITEFLYKILGKELPPIPQEFKLLKNYPNPFNSYTTIRFGIPKEGKISITIYDILGQVVDQLYKKKIFDSGYHDFQLNMEDYSTSSGVYFILVQYGEIHKSQKIVYLK